MNNEQNSKGICAGFLMPHPPIILHEVGKGRENDAAATVAACTEVASRIAQFAPDTVVIISPHSPLFSDFLFIHDNPILAGSFETFGVPDLHLSMPQDSAFRADYARSLHSAGIPSGSIDISQIKRYGLAEGLDHGVLVPLKFITSAYDSFSLVALSSSAFENETLTKCGSLLAESALNAGKRVCVVASGDMSHRVSSESPYGKTEEGPKFDRKVCKAIEASDMEALQSIDSELRERAGECGYHSLIMMIAAMTGAASLSGEHKGKPIESRLLSYEAPFGIGYCVAEFGFKAGPKA